MSLLKKMQLQIQNKKKNVNMFFYAPVVKDIFLFYGYVLIAVLLIFLQLCSLFRRQQCTCVQSSKILGFFYLCVQEVWSYFFCFTFLQRYDWCSCFKQRLVELYSQSPFLLQDPKHCIRFLLDKRENFRAHWLRCAAFP